MARPSEYNEEVLAKAKTYLEIGYDEEEAVRSIAGLALFLEVSRSTVYDWASHEDKKEFSYIVEDILAQQERTLVNNGLTNKFNPSITKLMLTKHGYSDKIESQTDVTSKGDKISFQWQSE